MYAVGRNVIHTFSANVMSVLGYHIIHYAAVALNYTLLGQGCVHGTICISIPGYDIWSRWKRLSCLLVWISQLNWQGVPSLTRQLFFSLALTTSGKTDELGDSNSAKAA